MGSIFIYHRGTRLGKIARELKIPVQLQDPNRKTGWIKVGRGRINKLIISINWGCLRVLPIEKDDLTPLNLHAINAARKIRAFNLFSETGIPCPPWHTNFESLNKELDPKRTIFARMDGLSGGKGIEIIKPEDRSNLSNEKMDKLQAFDFFTGKISHQREFRIHIWCGETIIEQVKFIPPDSKNPIHNHENGCKFSTASFSKFLNPFQRDGLRELAQKAVSCLKLDFGAVDIIQDPDGKFFVLEINTAPGIRSDPVEQAYKQALKGLIKSV